MRFVRSSGIAAALLLAGALILPGCDQAGWLEVVIDARGIEIPSMLDEVEVQVVATEEPGTEAGEASTCLASSRVFPPVPAGALSMPINVVFTPGQASWSCVAVRAEGRLEGEAVLRAEELYCPDLTETQTVELWLEGACHRDELSHACGEHRVCLLEGGEASCQPSNVGSLFDLPADLQRSCDGE